MAIKKRTICGACCTVLFLSLFLFALIGLHSLIDEVILEGVVLAPDTVDTWGNNPGSTGTLTLRNFTFFNLTNPRQFLYRNQKPVFHQVTNFLMQERSNFTDIVYSQDQSYIDYNYWLYFTPLPHSKDFQQQITVLNLAPIGFWSQLAGIDLPNLAIQGFGGLFVQMNNTIKMQAIGQGVKGQYLANYSSFASLCSILQIQPALCGRLYNDSLYGLGNENNYEIWVDFSYYNNTDSQFLLYEYFNLKRIQLQSFDKIFQRWCYTVDTILDNWYCSGPCKNYDLTILQLSSSGLTGNPPSGDAADSICLTPKKELLQNVSCQGYPELYSFLHYQFLPKIDNSSQFQDLNFSKQTVRQLYSPYNGTLLNVGNLSRLFQIGNDYDLDKSNDNLNKLIKETHGETDKHAVVIWQYVKYFAYEFVLQSKDGGTKQIAGLGGVFSQALYESFTQFSDWIIEELLAIKVAQFVPDCPSFLLQTIQTLTVDRAKLLCSGVTAESYKNYSRLIRPCNNEYFADTFQKEYGLSAYELSQLCNQGQPSILTAILQAHSLISSQYHCRDSARCTAYELAAKQFINSQITKNPLLSPIKQYPKGLLTAKNWNSDLQQWQYRHFLQEVYGDSGIDPQTYDNYTRLSDLLSFDKFFNGPMIQNLTLVQNQTFFEQLYYFKNKSLLLNYIRFVTIEVGFGGFTQKRSANELLFGYEDPFLKNLKEMDPMLGGDPSIETKVALNQPNATLDQAKDMPQSMYTGYSDPMLTRIYRTYQRKDFITYNHTYYDGYQVHTEWISPYKAPAILSGTDAVQEKPMSTPQDKQYVFIDSLYRVGELNYNSTVQRFGFDALRYTISDRMLASSADYPPNANYYQSIRGFMNLSFMGLPLFASKSHFLGAQDKWRGMIQLYDESGKYAQYGSDFDETQVIMQPKSGATFVATIYLQTNVYLSQDILFTREPHMLPVFTIYRSGNMTADAADDLLGDLKIALAAPTKIIFLSLFAIIFTVFSTIACTLKQERAESNSSSLLSSTHQEEEHIEEADRNSDLAD